MQLCFSLIVCPPVLTLHTVYFSEQREIRLLWLLCCQLYYFLGEPSGSPNWIVVVCIPSTAGSSNL